MEAKYIHKEMLPIWAAFPEFPPSLYKNRSPHGYINQRLQIQFGALADDRYAARNVLSLQ
jgi:hypothetical protein